MIQAHKVGTAAGTTTLVLGGVDNDVQCPTPAAMAFQVQSLGPPSDFSWMKIEEPWWQKWWGRRTTAVAPVVDPAARLPNGYVPTPAPNPAERVSNGFTTSPNVPSRVAYNPYAETASMEGPVRSFFQRVKSRLGLGLVLAPYGDISPQLYSEIADIENNVHYQCAPFDPQYNQRGESGFYYDTPLGHGFAKHGIVGQALAGSTPPTDLQLSRIYGYVPVVNSGAGVPGRYIDRPGETWTAAPYMPPNGGGPYGTWGPPLRGARRGVIARIKNALNLGDAPLPEGGIAPEDLPPGAGANPNDPSSLALRALNKHQDRMFLLGIVSTGAVAITTAHNLLKDRRKRSGSGHAVTSAVTSTMSGARRRRSRR